VRSYGRSFNGFAAKLTKEQAARIKSTKRLLFTAISFSFLLIFLG